MTEKQLKKVIKLQREYLKEYPNWREGQTFFNALYDLYPEVANKIRGTELDPFHNNHAIPRLLNHLLKLTEKT